MFQNFGYCYCCCSPVKFIAENDWWRDYYVCNNCKSIPRERALMFCIDKFYPNWNDLIIHESSPGGRGASKRLQMEGHYYIPSQFFTKGKPGNIYEGCRCENLESLTFASQSIDLHITQDVMEHVFDPVRAFKEISRTLKPGGAHIFTTPLINKNLPTQFRAKKGLEGQVIHLVDKPESHCNPVDQDGSLVTVHWGYDITRFIFDATELFTDIILIDSLELGIRAEYIEVLITRKPISK